MLRMESVSKEYSRRSRSVKGLDGANLTVGRKAGPGYGLAADPDWEDWPYFNLYFGGPHPGVCLFVFGDGHVNSLSVSINTMVLGYMATKDGAEVVGSDGI